MAKTPYNSLKSEDILAAHISGLQTDINKIQEVLDMKTSTRSGHSLEPVTDQEDPALRYRIYEATERNWLESPTPTIYRNGLEVPSDEYILHAPYGVVVFHEQQNSEHNITADFTHVIGGSNKVDSIDGKISDLESDVSGLDTRVTDLEEAPSGGMSNLGVTPIFTSGSYVSHQRRNYFEASQDSAEDNTGDPYALEPAFNILVEGGTLDAFPMPIYETTTFSRAGIMLGDGTGYPVRVRIGVYSDDNGRPGDLIYGTNDIIVSPGEWGYQDNINLTLEPGFYWIARQDKSDCQWNGLNRRSAINIQRFDAESFLQNLAERPNPFTLYGGYRATDVPWTDDTSMPSTYPSQGELFSRTAYGTPWLVVE